MIRNSSLIGGYGITPDEDRITGGDVDNIQPLQMPSLLDSMEGGGFGGSNSFSQMALMQLLQPQGNPFLQSLMGGAQMAMGDPQAFQRMDLQRQQQQQFMVNTLLKMQTEQRQVAIAEANMAMAQRRQSEVERANQAHEADQRETQARLKDEQNFKRADRDLTLAQHFMASDDPTTRLQAGPLFSSGYKTLGKPEPTALIQSLASPNPPKKEAIDEARRMVNAGMADDTILKQLPSIPPSVLSDMRELFKTPGAAEKFGLPSNTDVEKKELSLQLDRAKVWKEKYGIEDPALGNATVATLNKWGYLPEQAPPDIVLKARDKSEADLTQKRMNEAAQLAQINLAKQKEYAQFAASLKIDQPLSITQFKTMEKMISPIAANLEMTDEVRNALAKIPKDALPKGDTWFEGQSTALNRWWSYKNNEEWRKFSTFIIPKLIGFDRSTLDDIGQKSIKAFGPALEIIEGGGVPSEKTITGIIDIIDKSERRKANAIFSGLVQTRQPQDVIEYARNTLGKYLDDSLIRSSATPLSPVLPQQQGGPLTSGMPPAVGNKGRVIRNPETGQRMKSDGINWSPVGND